MNNYQLIPAVGTTDADGITTFTNRPPGAPLFYLDDQGGWVPVGEASPATSTASTGAAYYDAHYVATVAGAQPPITITGALKFFNVSVDGEELVRGLDYTDDGQGTLTIDARYPVKVDSDVQYSWLTSALQAGAGPTYTAGAGIAISPANEISATDYTDAEVDALLVPKISKQDADVRYGQLAIENTWQRDQIYSGSALFTSSYLPLRVQLSAYGIVVDNKGPIAVNIGTNYVQWSDGTVSASFVLTGGKLVFSGAPIEVPDPTTPQGIASRAYVDRLVGTAAPFVGYVNGALVSYETFELACNARPTVLHVRTPTITLTATNRTFSGVLYAADAEFTVPDGMELRFSRNSQVYNANISTPGTGVVAIIGAGTPNGVTALPAPADCLQLIDCTVGNLRFAVNSYQGLVLRGNTTVAQLSTDAPQLASVPAYLFDYSTVATVSASFSLLDRRPGAATGASTGIDYANPVTLTAAAGLLANNAYYVTGSGYQLDLPQASANLGKAIFVSVAASATGLYPVNGAVLTLYAAESMHLRATADGWKKTGGELLAMSAEIQTSLQQQDSITASGGSAIKVPFSLIGEANGPADLVNLGANAIVVQRAGRAALRASVTLMNVSNANGYALYLSKNGVFIASANLPVGDFSGSLLAIGEVTKTARFAAGDVLTVSIYTTGPGNYRGTYDGSQAIFSFTEIV